MKKSTCKILIVLLIAVLLFVGGCKGGFPGHPGNTGSETWSVFVYMCGTDLESDYKVAASNIGEMISADMPERLNLIVQTGGTRNWSLDGVDSSVLQRYVIRENGYELADEQPLASMGSAETLGEFLKWGVETYPADNYAVVLWNHGGGSVYGLMFDELFGYDSLTLGELAEGLAMSGEHFEMIGFDACLMASLETAAAIAPYGEYMVASEEYEPGGGWDYRSFIQYFSEGGDFNGAKLGIKICDSYYRKCVKAQCGAMATLSVVDLDKIDRLCDTFDEMAGEMTGVTAEISSLQALTQAAARSENYGGNTPSEGYTNMVDLRDLAENTGEVLSKTSRAVVTALNAAVVYNISGESRSFSYGLSVFYPLAYSQEMFTAFAPVSTSDNYLKFIESVSGWDARYFINAENIQEVESVNPGDYTVAFETYITEDGFYNLQITSGLESVASVQFSLYYMDYDYGEYMLMGVDNDITPNWDSGLFKDNFRGVWPTIEGCVCAPVLICEESDYNIYSIPVLLNGEETNLRAAYIWNSDGSGYFDVYGSWSGIDAGTGMSGKDIKKLEIGDVIEPLFECYNWDTGETKYYTMGSFTAGESVLMEESDLIDGDYLYMYEITDVFGNVYYSDSIIVECAEGNITLYEAE